MMFIAFFEHVSVFKCNIHFEFMTYSSRRIDTGFSVNNAITLKVFFVFYNRIEKVSFGE